MARIERVDRGLASRLDVVEQQMFLLKIEYEKYFSGLERVEPLRTRLDITRTMRDFGEVLMKNGAQRFRYQSLKARWSSLELYWTRNLLMMERGTHPKMKFRADGKQAARPTEAETLSAQQAQVLQDRQQQMEREDRAYRLVYEKYLDARKTCGQSTDLSFDAVRDALRNQVRQIKSTYAVETVKFRIVVENGKAKVKAVPQQAR